jgi:hypothetical protein
MLWSKWDFYLKFSLNLDISLMRWTPSGRQSGLFPAKTNLLHRRSGSFVFVSTANIYSIMIDSSLQTISPEGEPIKRIGSGFSIMAPFISKALAELRLQLLSTMLKQLTKLGGVSQDQKGGRC